MAEQLLHVKKGYIHVFEPSIEDFKQIYELRMAIETAAAELAVPYFDEKSRIWMETNLAVTRQAVQVLESFHYSYAWLILSLVPLVGTIIYLVVLLRIALRPEVQFDAPRARTVFGSPVIRT